MALPDLRREYNLAGLRRADVADDPFIQFQRWFDQQTGARLSGRFRKFLIRIYKRILLVTGAEPVDINAMTLATVDATGHPSARIVLLKGMDPRGFLFYTNYQSRKGTELEKNPNAALVFYWPDQERQVNVAGRVSRLTSEESAKYFYSRPRGSRIGAWASDQTRPIRDRRALEAKWAEAELRFHDIEVSMPPHWGGYVLAPERFEFWQGRPNRMHDRFSYTRDPAHPHWQITRLQP